MRTDLLLTLAALIFWAAPAQAHQLDPRHRAIANVQTAPDGALTVEVLLMMEIPKGKRADRLRARFDLDRSGQLEPLESRMLASELGPEVVGGYVLRLDGKAQRPDSLQETASVTGDGGLAVLLLLEYRLKATQGRVAVHVLEKPMGQAPLVSASLATEVQVQAPLEITDSVLPVAKDAPVVGPAQVKPGSEGLWVEVRAPQRRPKP